MFHRTYRLGGSALGPTVVAGALLAGAGSASGQATETPHFSVAVTEDTDIVEEAGTTRRIDRDEIEQLDARTLDEALRLLPGVYVRTGGQGTPRVDLRGWRSRHVLLLVDGIPVNSTDDGQFDPTEVSTEAIQEIKATFGNSSVLYGDNAVAGVIEVTTRPVSGGFQGTAGVDIRRGGQQRGEFQVTGGTARLSILASGSGSQSDGFRLPGSFVSTSEEDGALRANSDRSWNTGMLKVGYTASARVELGGLLSVAAGEHGLPPTVVDDGDDTFAQRPRYERVEDTQVLSGQVSGSFRASPEVQLRAWAFVNQRDEDRVRYDDEWYATTDDERVSGTFRRRDETAVTGGAVHGLYDAKARGRIRVSLNTRRESYETRGQIRDVRLGGGGGGGAQGRFDLRSFEDDRQVGVHSLAGEWEARPEARTGIVVGLSGTWQNLPGRRTGGLGWLAGLTRQLTPRLAVKASAARKLRVPSIRQLYEEATGNPGLEAERSVGVEVGVDRRWDGGAQVEAAAFWTWADRFIERDESDLFVNRGTYRFAGIDTTLVIPIVRAHELRIGYSFLDSVARSLDAVAQELQNRPRHRAAIDGRWALPAELQARTAVYLVGRSVYYSRRGPLQKAEASAYGLVDVSVGRAIGTHWHVSVGVDNLLDQLYEEEYGLPREGRTVLIRLKGSS